MENFSEFEQPVDPHKTAGDIISHAFEMYKGVFLYALLAMVMYVVGSFLIQTITGFDSMSLSQQMRSGGFDSNISYWDIPGIRIYSALSVLLGVLLSPLYVGLIYIANKFNFKEHIEISDLFIGYKQNTVNILIYALITNILIGIAAAVCVIPVFFVLPLFLIGYPVLLFENATFSEALSKSFNIAKDNYGVFIGASLLGVLISAAGIILCCIGVFATLPFYLMVMYSAYCAYCGRPKTLALNR